MSKEDWFQKLVQKQHHLKRVHGFYAHYVSDDPDTNPGVNYHTHGFDDTWGHVNFQIVLPLRPEVAHGIFWTLADLVKGGRKFEAGDHEGVITNFPVRMVEAWNGDEEVLRVLLPDENGKFPGEESCDEKYARCQTPEKDAQFGHKRDDRKCSEDDGDPSPS